MHKLSIKSDEHGLHHVSIDGNEIKRVRSIGVEISADNPSKVIIEFDTTCLDIELNLDVGDEIVLRGKDLA